MLPLLLPLVTAVVPEMAKWLFPANPKAGAAVAAVTDVVQSVTGGDASTAAGVAAIGAKLAGNPELGIQLQQKLAELHASMQAEADQASQAALAAQLADVANARSQTVSLAQAHSAVEWAPAIVSIIIMVGLAALACQIFLRGGDLQGTTRDLAFMLVTAMISGFSDVRGYWLGSSAGSARKDATIASANTALANSAPVAPAS